MPTLTERLQNIDRRVVYMIVLVLIIIPLFIPFRFRIEPEEPVKRVYDKISALAEDDQDKIVLIVTDWDPQVKAELYPQVQAVVRHLMEKRVKFAVVTLLPTGVEYSKVICQDAQKEYNTTYKGNNQDIVYGEDWCHWGFLVGGLYGVRNLAGDIPGTLKADFEGTPIQNLPMMEKVKNIRDISYVLHTTGAPLLVLWLQFFQLEDYRPEMASGCTSVMIPENYRFYDSNQITGLLGGLRGAADYEKLIGFQDRATEGMDCESLVHFLIMALIVLSNTGYLIEKRRSRRTQ